ncbi:unnamed protein product [Arctogadus glacialis]
MGALNYLTAPTPHERRAASDRRACSHHGNTNSMFALDYISGSLTVNGQLDRENPLYSAGFTITVRVRYRWGGVEVEEVEEEEEEMVVVVVVVKEVVLEEETGI